MVVMLSVGFVTMAGRLVLLQVVQAPAYARQASAQRQREIVFPARRGAIFDRSGKPLALSVDFKTVFADPAHVTDVDKAATRLARVLKVPKGTLAAALRGREAGDRFEFLARQVEPRLARRVDALGLEGVYLQSEPERYYPGDRLAAHVLGFVDVDGEGLSGIELQYEDILEGEPGKVILEQDPDGRQLPQSEFARKEPTPGQAIFLTLDKELQYFTELTLADAVREFHASAGSAIVMRPSTGEILALANVPTFDPNEPGDFSTDEHRNRAITDVYEPGSAFKVVALSGALEAGVVSGDTTFTVADSMQVSDRVFHDSHSHPTERMTVAEIIEQSSNVGTIQLGLGLGKERLDRYVRAFGFGSRTGLDFPGESPGIVLDPDDWTGPTIATVPIGQGIAVTALQMAAAYSTIANGGKWVEPKIVSAIMGSGGELTRASAPATKRVISRTTAARVRRILTGVVTRGTGMEAQVPGYTVAGKTGTAQKPDETGGYGDTYFSSFAGFAPANRPGIVTLVLLDEPSPIWGGLTAAPTFRKITEFALRHLGVPPTENAARSARAIEATQTGAAPRD